MSPIVLALGFLLTTVAHESATGVTVNWAVIIASLTAVLATTSGWAHSIYMKRKKPHVELETQIADDHQLLTRVKLTLEGAPSDGLSPAVVGLIPQVKDLVNGREEMKSEVADLKKLVAQCNDIAVTCNKNVATVIQMLTENGKNTKNPGDQIAIIRDEIAKTAKNQKIIMEHLGIDDPDATEGT